MKNIVVTTQDELDALGSEVDANIEVTFSTNNCNLIKVGGYLKVYGEAKLYAPTLTSVGGGLYVYGEAKLDALTSVGGDLNVRSEAKLDTPSLTSVGGGIGVYDKAKLYAPTITSIGTGLYVSGEAKLDALTSVGEYLSVYEKAKLYAPALTSIGDGLYVYGEANLDALTSVGGILSVSGKTKLDALTSVGGGINVYRKANLDAPALTSVGGDVSVHVEAKLDAPALTFFGEYLSVYEEAKLYAHTITAKKELHTITVKKELEEWAAALRRKIKLEVRANFLANGFLFADGILGKIINKKELSGNTVYTLAVNGGLKQIYCIEKGDTFSHGDSVEDAIKSLRYKLLNRDTSRFKSWKTTDTVSIEDAIQAYRAITGACEYGVRNFCESRKIPEKLTIAEVITLTKGSYGNKKFAEFFGDKK